MNYLSGMIKRLLKNNRHSTFPSLRFITKTTSFTLITATKGEEVGTYHYHWWRAYWIINGVSS